MNTQRMALSTSLVALALLAGCQNTADKQQKADQAQVEADQKRVLVEQQAQQKAAEAQNAAQQEATKEQRKADDKQNEALSTLGKEQTDYLSKVNRELDDLNGKVNDLQAASGAETAFGQRAEDNRVLAEVTINRNTLQADAKAILEATTTNWPVLKDRIDKDLDNSKSSARTASVRIKSSPR